MNAGYWRRYLRRASPISSFVDCQQPVLSPPVSARGFAARCQSSSLPLPKHRGKEKPAGAATHCGLPCGKFCIALPCERAEHPPCAGDWQELFHLAQSFFDEEQHIHAVERRAVAERGPCENYLQRAAGTFQLRFREDFGWLAHSGRWPALRHSCGETGRTAREQARHFRARLSGTPVAPWAA